MKASYLIISTFLTVMSFSVFSQASGQKSFSKCLSKSGDALTLCTSRVLMRKLKQIDGTPVSDPSGKLQIVNFQAHNESNCTGSVFESSNVALQSSANIVSDIENFCSQIVYHRDLDSISINGRCVSLVDPSETQYQNKCESELVSIFM
ncbi:hypothetical protein N9O57_00235 [bacterium]|nr:hypothetical protein [bacterium]